MPRNPTVRSVRLHRAHRRIWCVRRRRRPPPFADSAAACRRPSADGISFSVRRSTRMNMSSPSSVRPSPTSSLSSAGIPADPPLTQTSSPSGRVTSSSSLDGTTSACASPFFASTSCARPGTDARPSHRRPHLPDDLAAHLGRVLPRLCRALCRGASPFAFSTPNFSSYAELEPYAATGQPDHNLVSNVRRSSPSLSLSL